MPIATASSAYVLEDRASPALRGIRQEAVRTTAALRGTADAGDKIGAPAQLQRLERFEKRLGSVARTAENMSGRVQRTVGHMEGVIRRDTLKAEARITALGGRMDELARKRAAPRVDLDGYAVTLAQIASLDRAIAALGRRTATMGVGTTGGGAAAAAAGGAGRAAGRSGAFIGSGGVGFGTTRRGLIAGAAVTALPVVSALTGTILPLAGSLSGATVAGGATSLAAGGALAAGIGAVVSVAKPANAAVKELRKEQERYTEAVRAYGPASEQALEAQKALDAQVRKSPAGARNLIRELDALTGRWRRVTQAGQTDILGLRAGAAQRVRSASPFLGEQSNRAAGAVRREGLNFTDWATSPAGLIIVRDLTDAFVDNLDEAEGTLENIAGTFGNIARASRPFFDEGMDFLERWTGGWEHSTRDIGETRRTIGGYLNDLKAWGRLGGAGFDLIRDLIMPGRQQGTSAVEDLTMQLREWDDWAKRNPERIRRFYRDSIDGTKELAGFIGVIARDLHEVGQLLLPILSRFAQLGQLAGGAGLLLPTLLRLGLGRAMGGRGAGGGGAGGGAGAGGSPIIVGGPGRAAGAAPRTDWTGWTGGTAARPTSRLAGARQRAVGGARSAGRFAAPVAGISGVLGAAGTQGDLNQRVQGGVSALTFGALRGPTTSAQAREQGEARAIGDVERLNVPRSPADYRRQIARLERQRAAARAKAGPPDRAGSIVDKIPVIGGASKAIGDTFFGDDEAEARRNAAAVKKYTAAIRELRAEQRSYRNEQDRRKGVASQAHGGALASSLQEGFGTLRRHEGPEAALQQTVDKTVAKMRQMRPEGAKILGESMLEWGRTIARGNPRMQAIVADMTSSIERRFARMGKRVEVVNGRILTGSRSEWRQISNALSMPAEEAQQRVTKAFTAIQREAIGSLKSMGFSSSEATAIVKGRESGGDKGRAADYAVKQGPDSYQAGVVGGQKAGPPSAPKRARGGRIPGQGLADKVPFGDSITAPGELWIANRHTERRVDRMLEPYGTTLAGEIEGETDPHGSVLRERPRLGRGGRVRRDASGANVQGVDVKGSKPGFSVFMDHFRRLFGHDLYVMSGFRGGSRVAGSGRVSNHASGDALDISNPRSAGGTPQSPPPRTGLDELHGYIRANIPSPPTRDLLWRTTTGGNHYNHVHWGADPSVTASIGAARAYVAGLPEAGDVSAYGGVALGGDSTAAARSIRLKRRRSGMRGVPGAMADRAMSGYATGLERRVNRKLGSGAAAGISGVSTGGGSVAELIREVGLPSIFNAIVRAESNNNPRARNPSGASGLAQIMMPLHAGLVARYGGDVFDRRTNLRVAKHLYDESGLSPWAASRHAWGSALNRRERGGRVGWYGRGGEGTAKRPTLIGVGDAPGGRGEDFKVTPRRLGPPSSRAGARGTGGTRGLGNVTIQSMTVHWQREGDLKKAIKAEVHQAFAELADELDDGVDADEDALIR